MLIITVSALKNARSQRRAAVKVLALRNAKRPHATVAISANVLMGASVSPVQHPASVMVLVSVERAALELTAASVIASVLASEAFRCCLAFSRFKNKLSPSLGC